MSATLRRPSSLQKKALGLMTPEDEKQFGKAARRRLHLYQAGQPYCED
jgi:hypothetical protein